MSQIEVMRAIQRCVLEDPKTATRIAKEIGKPYSTLLREINPFDKGAKLGVDTLLAIIVATGNTEPLELMAKELGYSLNLTGGDGDAPQLPRQKLDA